MPLRIERSLVITAVRPASRLDNHLDMARFFTSDLHLGHSNIIRYCDRPFAGVDEMNRGLTALWTSVVGPEDEVWVLGDLAMGRMAESLATAQRLPGRKHLVVGNHDGPFKGRRTHLYEEAGFQLHHGHVALSLSGDVDVLACHFPYHGDSGDRDRHLNHRPTDEGRWLIHGHVHEKWRQRGRMINVGVDAWGGLPISETTILEVMSQGENDLAPLPWNSARQ